MSTDKTLQSERPETQGYPKQQQIGGPASKLHTTHRKIRPGKEGRKQQKHQFARGAPMTTNITKAPSSSSTSRRAGKTAQSRNEEETERRGRTSQGRVNSRVRAPQRTPQATGRGPCLHGHLLHQVQA